MNKLQVTDIVKFHKDLIEYEAKKNMYVTCAVGLGITGGLIYAFKNRIYKNFKKFNEIANIKKINKINLVTSVKKYIPFVNTLIKNEIGKAIDQLEDEILKPYKEAVRRSIGILGLPNNSNLALKTMYKSTDEIWKAAGDRATDFSFYTKRVTLAGIYSSSLMYWLGLTDPDLKNVEQFIDRRLDNVNMIGKFTKPIKDTIKFSFDPLSKFSFFNFNK